jgi:N-acetylgalactosamine kinase
LRQYYLAIAAGRSTDMDVAALKEAFTSTYPEAGPPQVCRAPGRINLVGEHVDYCGLPVLPMTVNRELRIAFAPRRDSTVRLRTHGAIFEDASFENSADIAPSPQGAWDNYCKAAIQGLNAHCRPAAFPGMDMLVWGNIPMAAGLSSSSALVVACALAYLKTIGVAMPRIELAHLLAEAEKYVGTQGGGMDQAIILLGGAGAGLKIDFYPLRAESVPLFEDCAVVACNSLVHAEKTGDARHKYNEGPLTCRLIRAMVEKQAQGEFGEELRLERLADLWFGNLCLTHAEVSALFDQTFPEETMTLDAVAATLDMTAEAVRETWLGDLRIPEKGFTVRARARHQLTEFQRVERARDLAQAGDAAGFGEQMNASHESCAGDYGVSCPELDKLVSVARKAGSLGSRLTGAGFGGCTVNLVPKEVLGSFREQVERDYYRRACEEAGGECVLVAEAVSGASLIE